MAIPPALMHLGIPAAHTHATVEGAPGTGVSR
jgi:hypothetical protein